MKAKPINRALKAHHPLATWKYQRIEARMKRLLDKIGFYDMLSRVVEAVL